MITYQLAIVLAYRALLIGALMYTVGYLNWSPWWLLLLLTIVTLNDKDEDDA